MVARPSCSSFPLAWLTTSRDPLHPAGVSVQPAPEQPFDRRLSGVELHEMEPPAQGEVHQGDRAVGGVHGADDVEILGQGEGGLRVLEAHLLVAILQQEIQLAEDLGEVPPVDLVDDEEVPVVRLSPGQFRHLEQWPVPELETCLALSQGWPVALDEVLVGVGRVELDEPHLTRGPGQAGRQFPGSIGLASAGRTLEDDLALVVRAVARCPEGSRGPAGAPLPALPTTSGAGWHRQQRRQDLRKKVLPPVSRPTCTTIRLPELRAGRRASPCPTP